MKYISHRGNINGVELDVENTTYGIDRCLDLSLDIEIDIWYLDDAFYLGHDFPKQKIDETYLTNPKIWCHAKNTDALFHMKNNSLIHCFWHNTDDYTITSKGIIWAYPGKKINNLAVCVSPEKYNYSICELERAYGICSDDILYCIRYLNRY